MGFDGSEAVIPKSQVFGPDFGVSKCEAYWISDWILGKKQLQYSNKKEGWYNPDKRTVEPSVKIVVEKHIPTRIEPKEVQPHASLIRQSESEN